ncbi:MAG: phosphoribosylanthranilate isomerase [Planctomycetota bacterium]|nr:phosphoribosylanthranilate isomerase [Planctomycetota bacterium]
MSGPLELERTLAAKVCGLARAVDVAAAIEAGADYAGFVSYPRSPRHLGDAQIVTLAAPLVGTATRGVLVTVDRPRLEVERVVEHARLGRVQLCGSEDPADWRSAPFVVLRRVGADADALAEISAWAGVADAFVLDHPKSPGGSGQRVGLEHVLPALAEGPCLLAGGLTAEALEEGLDPRLTAAGLVGVDASSGLESSPGEKNIDAVRRFVAAAHRTPIATR